MIEERQADIDTVVFWLERAVDGTAAGLHLRGTLARLGEVQRVRRVAVVADRSMPDGTEPVYAKLGRLLRLTLRAMRLAKSGRLLLGRHHPLILPAVLVWRLRGGRVLLSVQGSLDAPSNEYPRIGGSKLLRGLSRAATKVANGVIVGAPPLEQQVREEMVRSSTPVKAIPNGVFVGEMAVARSAERPLEVPYVVFVGNLAHWQGVDVMVDAVTSAAWPEGVPLVVVGDGVESHRLFDCPGIIHLGRLPAADAMRWYAHAECALSMQRGDSAVGEQGYWPFKIVESAAVGIPVVCSDAKGLPEAAKVLGNAIVVPDGDGVACARAVARICGDAGLRNKLGATGLGAVSRYDWTAGGVALSELMQEVM